MTDTADSLLSDAMESSNMIAAPNNDNQTLTSSTHPIGVDQVAMERELLGVFMKKPSVDLARMLHEFGPPVGIYTSRHRLLVKAAIECLIYSEELDVASLQRRLKENGDWEKFGGSDYWSELVTQTARTQEEFPALVHQLRDFHIRESMRLTMELALGMVREGGRDSRAVINFVQEELVKIANSEVGDRPVSVAEILDKIHNETAHGTVAGFTSYETGFDILDKTISGASKKELILIGGAQGVGKTILAMQIARNIAESNQAHCLYICYEHDPNYLFKRLIPLESINPVGVTPFDQGLTENDVIDGIMKASEGRVGFIDLLRNSHRGKMVLDKIEKYKSRLHFFKGNSVKTTIQTIRSMVNEAKAAYGNVVVFIDYLQKVPVFPEPPTEDEKVTYITQGLKDLALSAEVPIFAVVAADREGLKAQRLHIFHLRGSSAIDYEADICLILNDKSKIISKSNVVYNPSKMKEFVQWVVCTVEKNRTGQKMVDLEFKKHFKYFCFDPEGRLVQETLIDEKIYKE
jgi:replicative DNA helicase